MFLWIGSGLDTVHLLTIIMALWHYLIDCFGDAGCLLTIPSSFIAQLVLAVSMHWLFTLTII
jgi:hypothetical protein